MSIRDVSGSSSASRSETNKPKTPKDNEKLPSSNVIFAKAKKFGKDVWRSIVNCISHTPSSSSSSEDQPTTQLSADITHHVRKSVVREWHPPVSIKTPKNELSPEALARNVHFDMKRHLERERKRKTSLSPPPASEKLNKEKVDPELLKQEAAKAVEIERHLTSAHELYNNIDNPTEYRISKPPLLQLKELRRAKRELAQIPKENRNPKISKEIHLLEENIKSKIKNIQNSSAYQNIKARERRRKQLKNKNIS